MSFPHPRQNRLRTEIGGLQIDRNRSIEILFCRLVSVRRRYARVVHQNIDWPEMLLNVSNHGLHGGAYGDIAAERFSATVTISYLTYHCVCIIDAFTVVHRDCCACLCQRLRDSLAYSSPAAGDQRHTVFESTHAAILHLSMTFAIHD